MQIVQQQQKVREGLGLQPRLPQIVLRPELVHMLQEDKTNPHQHRLPAMNLFNGSPLYEFPLAGHERNDPSVVS